MFLGRYSEIFGRGERLGCILNLDHSFDVIEAHLLNFLVCRYTLARFGSSLYNVGAQSRIISHLGTWDYFGHISYTYRAGNAAEEGMFLGRPSRSVLARGRVA